MYIRFIPRFNYSGSFIIFVELQIVPFDPDGTYLGSGSMRDQRGWRTVLRGEGVSDVWLPSIVVFFSFNPLLLAQGGPISHISSLLPELYKMLMTPIS